MIERVPTADDRELARALLRTAFLSRLEQLPKSGGRVEAVLLVRDCRGLSVQLVEMLCEPKYRDALRVLSEGSR